MRAFSQRVDRSVGWVLRGLAIAPTQYHRWAERYGRVNTHNGLIPRDHWLTPAERQAILGYHATHAPEGYRRLTFMMLDDGIVAVSPATVYRVLKGEGLLDRWTGTASKKGTGFQQPLEPHEHWHVDIRYLNLAGTFYYLCSILDGCSRFLVHWELRERMTSADVETVIQRAREQFPDAHPRIAVAAHSRACEDLRRLAFRSDPMTVLAEVADIEYALIRGEHDLVVLDPVAVGQRAFFRMLGAIERSGCPVVWYSDIGAEPLLIDAAERGFGEFVLREHVTGAAALRRRILRARTGTPSALLLVDIVAHLKRLPAALRRAWLGMFGGAPVPTSVADLAQQTGWPRRSLDRAVRRAGFRTPLVVLDGLRVASSWPELAEQIRPLNRDLESAGFSTSRRAVASYKRQLGMTPRTAFRDLSVMEVASRLRGCLLTSR